ncbi:MAG: ABZJ_00895 family protein [Pseudomonadota bacterium]
MRKARLDFVIALPVAMVAMAVLSGLLEEFAGVQLGSSSSAVPFMVAIYYAGVRAGNHASEIPPRSQLWRVARELTLIAFVISALIAIPLLLLDPGTAEKAWTGLQAVSPVVWIAFILILVVIHVIGARFVFAMAMKSTLKAKQ